MQAIKLVTALIKQVKISQILFPENGSIIAETIFKEKEKARSPKTGEIII